MKYKLHMSINNIMEVFNVVEPDIYYKKDRGFWFIECRIKVASDTSDVGGRASSSLIRARSYMQEWGNKRYKKRGDALLAISTWMDFVVEALSKRGSVAKHSADILATDASGNQHQTIIDVTMQLLPRAHAMRCDDMQLPNMVTTFRATEELDTSGGSLDATEEEMRDFCASRTFLTGPHVVDSGFEAADDVDDWAHGNDVGSDRDMDDEERMDYIAPTMPHQEALRIAIALEPATEGDNRRGRASSSCDERQKSPVSKRARRDFNGGSLTHGLSTTNQGSDNQNLHQDIIDLRLEVKVIKLQLA